MTIRYATIEVQVTGSAEVIVQYDDCDYHPQNDAEDLRAMERLAEERISQSLRTDHDHGEYDINSDCRARRSSVRFHTTTAMDVEVMPKPAGWVLRRLRTALDGYVDPLQAQVTEQLKGQVVIEECEGSEWRFRRVITGAMGRLIVDGSHFHLAKFIDCDDGDLRSQDFEDTDEYKGDDACWAAMSVELIAVFGGTTLSWSVADVRRRFQDAFDIDDKGRARRARS